MNAGRGPGPRRLELAGDDGQTVTVQVFEPARARHLRLSIGRDGPRLSKPVWVPWADAVAFVHSRQPWLLARLRDASDCSHLLSLPALVAGGTGWLTLRGQATPLRVTHAARPCLAPDPHLCREADGSPASLILAVPTEQPAGTRQRLAAACLRSFLEQALRADCARLLGDYTARLGRAPVRLRLRPLHSLWGSLSARDHMSLDLALILAEPKLLEYVLVHELCHLFERNHGPRFWARVAALLPDYRQCRQHLNTEGQGLKAALAALLVYRLPGADSAAFPGAETPPA